MEVTAVKKQIQAKRLDNFFVFTGEEIEAQRIYVNKIAEVTGKPVKRIETVKEAFNRRASLLKVSYCFVCRDDAEFWKTATPFETVLELLGDNILILQMTDIDKRSKSYKSYSEHIVDFKYMDADTLYKYVQRVCSLSDDNTYELIDICGQDYSKLLLETDKINRYARAQACTPDEAYITLLQDGAINRPPKDAIFDFTDAFLRADIKRAFRLLEDCRAIGEPALRIITVLYSNLKRVLQVQVCEGGDICKVTGLTPWDVKLAKQTLNCWQSEDLVYFLKTLQRLEKSIKTGEVEEGTALDLMMVSLL